MNTRNLHPQSLLAPLLLVLCMAAPSCAMAQSYIETFGQNRLQNRKFEWKFFDTKHFRVYHYDKAGRQLGRYVAEEAENNIKIIEKKMAGQFPERFNIVLYNSYDDYRQTNIGLKDESQISQMTISGTWNLTGDKLVVYHTGKHTDLRRQIQAGMAQVVMEHMIYGESFKKMAKTALLLNLPEWVTTGFIAYLVDGWNPETNSEWKRLMDAQPKKGFHEFSEQYPEIAGKAFWKFVDEQYGRDKMKSLLSALQQKTSLNKTMKDKSYLGLKVTKAYDSCMTFYRESYAQDLLNQEVPDSSKGLISLKLPKDNTIIRNIRVSPRGTDIVYVAWKEGHFTIYQQKTSKDQVRSVLLEGGQVDVSDEIDPNYPMMAWSNAGNKLAILYKIGRKTMLRIYNNQKNRVENFVIPPNRFDRVLGMSFMQDDDKMVFSAIKKSQTDLYQFTIKGSKMANITDDAWDDIEPVFVSGGSRKGILFLSNRPKPNMNVPVGVNELPTGPMNLYFYNTTTMSTELLQCTNYTKGHVEQPIQYGADNFAYLYDGNGIQNKYAIIFGRDRRNMDSAYSVPVTNYNTSIISHQYNLAVDEVADVIQVKKKYLVYFHGLQLPNDSTPAKKLVPTVLSIEKPEPPAPEIGGLNVTFTQPIAPGTTETNGTMPEVKNGTVFQSEFSDTTNDNRSGRKRRREAAVVNATGQTEADSSTLAVINDSAYLKMKPSPYRRSFKADMFNVRVDNSVLFTQYQSYATNGGAYRNPGIGALTTVNIAELMEDYKLTAGFQIPKDLSSTTYFLQYKNTKKRLDWGLLVLRKQNKSQENVRYIDKTGRVYVLPQLFKNLTNYGQAEISYPFDRVRSFRFTTGVMQTKLVQKAQDYISLTLEIPNTDQIWSMNRAEYVFDNTISPLLNIRVGTRYKAYSEYMYQAAGGTQTCYNIGFDFRTYHKIYKNAIWATRAAWAHSDGNAPVQYQLGGVDNWIGAQTTNDNQMGGNYGFIALATSLRGYKQGARKANNFGVLSSEVRVPLVSFVKRPMQSALLKNLQGVAFMDMGSAWRGLLPTAENTSTTYSFPNYNNPNTSGNNNVFVNVTVPNAGGLALGYGAGIRTMLWGYFVRMDAAWNIEGAKKPIVYFAIGTDF